jgi:hypothetical protein
MANKDGVKCTAVLAAISAGYLAVTLSVVLSTGIGLDWGSAEEVEEFLRMKILSDLGFAAYVLVLVVVNMYCAKPPSILLLFSLVLVVYAINYAAVQLLVFG